MSDLSQKVRSLWWEADQLAKESKAMPLDADDIAWVKEAIIALSDMLERTVNEASWR